MKSLENFFLEYENRISTQTFSVSPAPDLKWKTESLEKTRSEIPVVKHTGNEISNKEEGKDSGDQNNKNISLVGSTARVGKTWRRNDGHFMNNLEIHETLLKENPVLHRPSVRRTLLIRGSLYSTSLLQPHNPFLQVLTSASGR